MPQQLKHYRLDGSRRRDLSHFDPDERPCSVGDKAEDKARVVELAREIDGLQDRFFAQRRDKLLLVLQGMDTSGKDGTIRAVFHTMDPLGVRAVSYKAPAGGELDHDFLWRHHRDVPGKGEVVIFNRSHYEAVLVEFVHHWIDKAERRRRFAQIVDFERMLVETGTTIVKCFLHISKDEQRRRLQERIDDPEKNWKFNPQDLEERKLWGHYQRAYGAALANTATRHAPWYVVPANSKTHRNLMVSRILLETFKRLKPRYPKADKSLAGLRVV